MSKEYKLGGFTRFEISEKEYKKFLLKTKEKYYITIKNTEKMKIILEIQDEDIKNIKKTTCYVFYTINKTLNFKIIEITFNKVQTKKDILEIKKEIVKDITNKIDDLNYSISPEDLLERRKVKYI
jgi:hypothetical protein